MKRIDRLKKRKRSRFLILAMLAVTGLLLFSGVTSGRYVIQREHTGVAAAKDFYFTSDLLKDDEADVSYYIDPMQSNFRITVSNSEDSLRVSSDDIAYSVSVLKGSAGVGGGTLRGGSISTKDIVITPEIGADQVTVKVSAAKPYAKSLKAVFHLALGNRYTVEDSVGNTAALLTVTCADGEKEIALSLPDSVVADGTDERVKAAAGGYVFQSPGYGVYSLVLLKSDNGLDLSRTDIAFADKIELR